MSAHLCALGLAGPAMPPSSGRLDALLSLPQMSDAAAATDGGVVAAPVGDQLEYDPATPWTALGSSSSSS